mgnify:CR=1 FL=1
MDDIQVFENDEFGAIRVIKDENGEPWFVAKDVSDILGYRSASDLTRLLDDDEKGTQPVRTPGGVQELSKISESGFYKSVMQRRASFINDEKHQKAVKRFQRWVTHEVLPAIRRDGGYMVARDESPEQTMARAVLIAQSTIERQKSRIAELEPKAMFADAVAASDGTCLVGELAKMMTQAGFKVGQNRLFAILRDDGYLGKSGSNKNVPLQRYVEQGLFRIKETAITHADGHVSINRTTKVTGKGQRYFIDRYCKVQKLA